MNFSERIGHGYFFAKQYVIKKGYAYEIDWQDQLEFESINEQKFLEEASWVILSSGMNEKVVKKVFAHIKSIMFDFKSADLINKERKSCLKKAMKIFNHPGKINAILYIVKFLSDHNFDIVKSRLINERMEFLQSFPYLGKATSYHLAKNLGLNVSKPDRHLNRISLILGFNDPHELCKEISYLINDKISLIDLVLWRYATLDKNYLRTISWFINRNNDAPS